jgi:hypothetical protein
MELSPLIGKIIEAIQRDVNNIYVKASGSAPLSVENQEALVHYLKVLTDARIQFKERELEEKIKRAEEVISRGTSSQAGEGKG